MKYRYITIEEGTPGYAAINPNTNKIYISYTNSSFILIVDLANGLIECKIAANSPGNIVVNRVTNKVYVSSAQGIYEIDGATNKPEVINYGITCSHGAADVNYVTNTLYTTRFGSGDTITAIDLTKKAVVDKIVVPKKSRFSSIQLYGVAVDSAASKVYVANYSEESIIIADCKQLDNLMDTIKLSGKWSNLSTGPKFILVNELSKLLYVHAFVGTPGGTSFEQMLVIDIDTKKNIQSRLHELLPSHAKEGFVLNRSNNTLYMKKHHEMTILKIDSYANRILNATTFKRKSFWQRFHEGFYYFAEVIAVNPSTNKVYVSDSKNNRLYEIDC